MKSIVKKQKQFRQTNKAFHGTNEPYNIGKPTSIGCVYHYDKDIIDLYTYACAILWSLVLKKFLR